MLARVNAVRAAGAVCGGEVMPPVGKVTWNEQLKNAATVQVLDMSTTGVQSHTGSNGSTAVSRAQAAGYASTYVGESIASGYADAEAVMAGWMGSPPHCKGMMNAPFDEIGVSCMQHVSGKKYFAISLGSRNQ